MSAKLLQARNVLRQAERNYQSALMAEYRIGSEVKWERAGRIHEGLVVEHGSNGRVLVRRFNAARSYWIYADDIARAAEFAAATRKAAA